MLTVTDSAGPAKNPVRILVPKKVARLAVRRNRLRRLVKESLRTGFHAAAGKTYTFRAVKDPGEIGLKETTEILNALLSDA